MAVNLIRWDNDQGYDMHVVAGTTSRTLHNMLVIDHGAPSVLVFANAPPANVTVRFRAAFNGVLVPEIPSIGGAPRIPPRFIGFGVTVNVETGTVEASNPLPATAIRNFIIHAEVTDNSVAPAQTFVEKIRVHVHAGVTRVWLTPAPLTIHVGADGQRFSVLAEFTDETVGDISRMPGLSWNSATAGDIAVDAATGALRAINAARSIDISVTPPANYGAAATARANSLAAWSTPATAKVLAGGPGAGGVGSVPNFLFVAEGFTTGEQAVFERKVMDFVTFLRTSKATRPYDLCSPRINYWTAWVESRERGTSPLYEIAPVGRGAQTFGQEVPQPEAPPAGAAIWTLPQLIHEVGLPVRAQAGIAFAAQRTEWTTIFGAGVAAHVNGALHTSWVALAERRLVDELDTAFGLALGQRPRIAQREPPRSLSWHPRRAVRSHLDQFLTNLRNAAAAGGPAIGGVWGAAGAKDRRFVNAICAGARRGGAQSFPPNELIAASLTTSNEIELTPVAGTRRFTAVPYPIPAGAPPLDTKCTVAHENAHALGLGDEYGGTLNLPASRVVEVNGFLNLQDAGSVAAPVPFIGIEPTLFKWNWPRIRAAGVLTGTPAPAGANFQLVLQSGQVRNFAAGDVVQLRTRPLVAGIVPSGECTISAVTAATNTITITPNGGVGIVPANFPAGSIVYATHPGPGVGPVVVGPPLGLISPTVLAHITTTGIPLNIAPVGAAAHVCTHDDNEVQWALNRPATLPAGKPKFSAWIVGAFEGGHAHSCGVFHPTGACLMRKLLLPERAAIKAFKVPEFTYRFCPVCRYILVDRLDPSQHGAIDRDYDPRYAQP